MSSFGCFSQKKISSYYTTLFLNLLFLFKSLKIYTSVATAQIFLNNNLKFHIVVACGMFNCYISDGPSGRFQFLPRRRGLP